VNAGPTVLLKEICVPRDDHALSRQRTAKEDVVVGVPRDGRTGVGIGNDPSTAKEREENAIELDRRETDMEPTTDFLVLREDRGRGEQNELPLTPRIEDLSRYTSEENP